MSLIRTEALMKEKLFLWKSQMPSNTQGLSVGVESNQGTHWVFNVRGEELKIAACEILQNHYYYNLRQPFTERPDTVTSPSQERQYLAFRQSLGKHARGAHLLSCH